MLRSGHCGSGRVNIRMQFDVLRHNNFFCKNNYGRFCHNFPLSCLATFIQKNVTFKYGNCSEFLNTYVRSHPYDRMKWRFFVVVERFGSGREIGVFEEGTSFSTGPSHSEVVRLRTSRSFRRAIPEIIRNK